MYEPLVSPLVKGRLMPNLADKMCENLEILRDASLSQECRAAAHAALEDDADLESLITTSSPRWMPVTCRTTGGTFCP